MIYFYSWYGWNRKEPSMENTLSNLSKPEKEATHLRSKPKGIQTLNNDNNTPYLIR